VSHTKKPETTEKAMDTVSPVKSLTRRISTIVAGAAGTVVLAGCAQNAPQDTWQPKGDNAQKISALDKIVFPIAGIVGVLVFAFAVYTFVKFRDRGQAVPAQSHGKPVIEIVRGNMTIPHKQTWALRSQSFRRVNW
jgi:hypothetical protein